MSEREIIEGEPRPSPKSGRGEVVGDYILHEPLAVVVLLIYIWRMVQTLNFYLDDSGTRHPDHKPGKKAQHGYDWFALGGSVWEGITRATGPTAV